MRESHQKGIVPGRIDHHEVMRALNRVDNAGEVSDLGPLVGFNRAGRRLLEASNGPEASINASWVEASAKPGFRRLK
jgi:hypothetical protein